MDCGDCLERLYTFLDTELSVEERAAVRSHIERCHDCGGHFELEARFLEQLRDCCTSDAAPPVLRERVIERLRGDLTADG